MDSNRVLNSFEIKDLLDRLINGESDTKIISVLDITSSTLANFKAYFIKQGLLSPIDRLAKVSNTETSKTLKVKAPIRKKRTYTRPFDSFKGLNIKEDEVYIRINKVSHLLEQQPKELILSPNSVEVLF